MTIQKFLIQISQILDELKIDYAVSGGVAVAMWGRPRYTADLDIIVDIENVDKIAQLVETLLKKIKKSYADKETALDAFKRKSEFNLIESEYGLKADFFVIGDDEHQKQEIKRSRSKRIAGKLIKFISPEDLIIAKLRWYQQGQSERQLDDIVTVLEAGNLDRRYLNLWIKKLGFVEEWEEVKKLYST